ncbi:MAG TPA: thiamine-phosphate kinase [Pirellulales bacterium]|jgi:thiamine-monophosphate kinase|nr:thiamine-phosphate kinase [Pirellulales bacterium]
MEAEFIGWLHERLSRQPGVALGIGDDAALMEFPPPGRCLLTVDVLTDGVDFRLAEVDPRRIGRKALAVNLSDIAAMAGVPRAALIGLVLPRHGALALAQGLYEGLLPLATQFGVAIAGGDTNTWDGPLAISITLVGTPGPRGPLRRDGAKPGDRILVTGALGGSLLGRHFDFEPRVHEALLLAEQYELHSGMDISDGLSLDLWRMARASNCGARLDLARVPVSAAAGAWAAQLADGTTALEHALSDGEDFELLLAAAPAEAARMLADQPLGVPISEIGEFTDRADFVAAEPDGSLRVLEPRGWLHASSERLERTNRTP